MNECFFIKKKEKRKKTDGGVRLSYNDYVEVNNMNYWRKKYEANYANNILIRCN